MITLGRNIMAVKVEGAEKIAMSIMHDQVFRTNALDIGLFKAATFLKEESQKIVPYETWELHNSARVERWEHGSPMGAAGKFFHQYLVSYNTHYAVYQHEDLNYQHKPGRMAKYLERPMHEKQAQMLTIIANEQRTPRHMLLGAGGRWISRIAHIVQQARGVLASARRRLGL